MNLKHNIRKLRRKRGLTQGELAHKLNLAGKTSVAAYEDGRAEPQIRGLIKLKKVFGVSIDDLILKRL